MKKILIPALCLLILLSSTACSSKMTDTAENGASAPSEMLYDSTYGYTAGSATEDVTAAQGTVNKNEKIIKTVDVSVQTKEYDAYISALNSSVAAVGGYIENSTADFGNGYTSNRYATCTVRIPADKLDEFLAAAGKKGTITSKTETQQNVTLEYVDLESRISAYETERETLTGLLEKAGSLADVLAIQERLSEVNYQIETYTSQLNVLANRINYSTVTIRISEVERITEAEPTVWQRIKNEFSDNLEGLVDWIKDAFVAVIGGLPVIIPAGGIIAALILILRRIRKKRKAKKNLI